MAPVVSSWTDREEKGKHCIEHELPGDEERDRMIRDLELFLGDALRRGKVGWHRRGPLQFPKDLPIEHARSD